MRRSHLLLAGLGITAVAVTGSAFTAANTVPNSVAGYGQGTVTGATVTNIAYTPAADATNLASVVFTSSTNVTGRTATMMLKQGTSPVGTSPYSCTLGTWSGSAIDITCLTPDNPPIANFNTVGLTVVQ
jgi:hypothetical protein